MRFYVKLALMLALFAGLASPTGRRMTGNLAYEARVFCVYHFGSDADFEHLLQDTDRMLAAERDALYAQLAAQRQRQLIRAAAAGQNDCAGRCRPEDEISRRTVVATQHYPTVEIAGSSFPPASPLQSPQFLIPLHGLDFAAGRR